jgi:SAM-dependent methyltransferase
LSGRAGEGVDQRQREGLSGEAYERFEYPGFAYPQTHPARIEAIARLFALWPKGAAESRVLELGCGDGGNLLSLAQALPNAQLTGIDAAGGAIERGREMARKAGLQNVDLKEMDLEELPEGETPEGWEEGFDYVVSHGVYSWIPPRARVALLAGVRRYLAKDGVAYVSYNAYPGSYLRDMARDILGYHVRGIEDPQERLDAARELMETIVAIEVPSPYAQVLREHMERMLRYSTALLFHDDLAEVATPFYFHEFTEHAAQHRLRFLAEAELSESQMRGVPESAERLMAALPDDVVVREQYLDFFKNRMFRQTLICHEEAQIDREIDDRRIEGLWISSSARRVEETEEEGAGETAEDQTGEAPGKATFATGEGFSMTTSEPAVQGAMRALEEAWPKALDFEATAARAVEAAGPEAPGERVEERLRGVLLQAYLARIVQLEGCKAPVGKRPEERPKMNALARAQRAAGRTTVSSLLHANVRLEGETEEKLPELLDGSRDREELARATERPEAEIKAALERFAAAGLLEE